MSKKLLALLFAFVLIIPCTVSSLGEETAPTAAPSSTPEKLPLGYVKLIISNAEYWLPLPTEEEYVYPLSLLSADGEELVNNIHLMPDGMYMESANCDNQQCVEQGIVTFENRESRILGNAILCLPHQLVLELYTLDEVMEIKNAQAGENP